MTADEIFAEIRMGMKDLSIEDIKEILRIEIRKQIMWAHHVDVGTSQQKKKSGLAYLSNQEISLFEKFEEEKPKKWFAYIDFTYSGTEEDNISGRTKSGKVLAVDTSDNETLLPFAANDSGHHKSTMEYDKTYTRGTSLTIGRILDQTSSLYLNLNSSKFRL